MRGDPGSFDIASGLGSFRLRRSRAAEGDRRFRDFPSRSRARRASDHSLSDERTEYLMKGRLSFPRFLVLALVKTCRLCFESQKSYCC